MVGQQVHQLQLEIKQDVIFLQVILSHVLLQLLGHRQMVMEILHQMQPLLGLEVEYHLVVLVLLLLQQ